MTSMLRGYAAYLGTALGGIAVVLVGAVVNAQMRSATATTSLVTLLATLFAGIAAAYTYATISRHRAAVHAIIRREAEDPMASALRGVRLLLVDDQQDELDVLAEALEARGAHVEKASTIADALVRLEQQPHLVLSDLAMPDDVARLMAEVRLRIAGDEKPLGAIALSKYIESFGKERIVELGFNAFLAKPILLDALVEEIQRQLAPSEHPKASIVRRSPASPADLQ